MFFKSKPVEKVPNPMILKHNSNLDKIYNSINELEKAKKLNVDSFVNFHYQYLEDHCDDLIKYIGKQYICSDTVLLLCIMEFESSIDEVINFEFTYGIKASNILKIKVENLITFLNDKFNIKAVNYFNASHNSTAQISINDFKHLLLENNKLKPQPHHPYR